MLIHVVQDINAILFSVVNDDDVVMFNDTTLDQVSHVVHTMEPFTLQEHTRTESQWAEYLGDIYKKLDRKSSGVLSVTEMRDALSHAELGLRPLQFITAMGAVTQVAHGYFVIVVASVVCLSPCFCTCRAIAEKLNI